jgi:hypothetical protein
MANLIFSILSEYNGKGLAKGKKDLTAFEKQTKALGKTLAKTLGAAALVSFGKKAVKAFMADEAAAKSLATQLQNMGFGFATVEVERYIASLEKSTGVLDDYLRPALQSLITASGSLTQSQRGLAIALDVSAATGKSVQEVSMALAKGFSGQTTAISRLGAGIDAATLKTGDMNKIMALLENRFRGQALARLNTYAGKMDLLQGAAARASETIGEDLINSIALLSGADGVQGAADSMENFATNIGNAVYGLSILIAQTKEFVGLNKNQDSFANKFLQFQLTGGVLGLGFQALANKGASAKAAQTQTNVGGYGGIPTAMEAVRLKELYAIKNAIALRKQENAALKAKTAVDQLKDKFDVERIGLMAALNAATDEETKLRIKAQIAILDNNEALAKKILAEMAAADAAKKFAENFQFALDAVKSMTAKINAFIASMGGTLPTTNAPGAPSSPARAPLTAEYFQDLATQLVGTAGYAGMNVAQIATERARESGNRSLDVNLVVNSPSGDAFAQLVAESIQLAGRSGYSTTGAGQLP